MRTQPNLGLRRFDSTIAAISSMDGPFGPGFRLRDEKEKRSRYLRSTKALWNLNSVAVFKIADTLVIRRGFTKRVISASKKRSSVLRFGVLCRERLLIRS